MAVTEFVDLGYKGRFENTSGYLLADGWRRIGADHGSYEHAYLFNVITGESASVCIYDYDEPRNEDRFWYYKADNEAALLACRLKNKGIGVGIVAKVVKGRKVPIGYTGKVAKIRRVYDRYDRWVANYAVFEDGTSTNVDNCEFADDRDWREVAKEALK